MLASEAGEAPVDAEVDPPEGPQAHSRASSEKANAPMFSASRRGIPPAFENKKVVVAAAALAILMVFAATYAGASFFFRNVYAADFALAGERRGTEMSTEKQRYITRLDRICSKSAGDVAELQDKILAAGSPQEMRRVFDEMAAKAKRELARVESFPKPKQDRRLLNRILSLQRNALPYLDRILDAVEERDVTALQTISAEAYADAAKSQRLMEEYGFQVCGRA